MEDESTRLDLEATLRFLCESSETKELSIRKRVIGLITEMDR